jgi:hypothetical protein
VGTSGNAVERRTVVTARARLMLLAEMNLIVELTGVSGASVQQITPSSQSRPVSLKAPSQPPIQR